MTGAPLDRRTPGRRARSAVALAAAAAALVAALAQDVIDADPAAGYLTASIAQSASSPGPDSSDTYEPAASFANHEHDLMFFGRLQSMRLINLPSIQDARTSSIFFGEVEMDVREAAADATPLNLTFAVEGQPDSSTFQYCFQANNCLDVLVDVRAANGLLHLYLEGKEQTRERYWFPMGDFERQSLELSASDTASGYKAYREVALNPPPEAAGCDDYGEWTPERYTCVFLRELRPADGAVNSGVNEATLRAQLPNMVQDKANYRLVFAEEFNGTGGSSTPGSCRDGIATLDSDVWNIYNGCTRLDIRGEPCGNVVNGAFVMSRVYGNKCGAGTNSLGKFHYKYGYLELKYRVNLYNRGGYTNYAFVVQPKVSDLSPIRRHYGVVVDDWEDFLRNDSVEIDIFEYVPIHRADYFHQYANWGFAVPDEDLLPTKSNKFLDFCAAKPRSFIQSTGCTHDQTLTVTKGLEWTPRGYRTHVKVDGFNSALTVVPKGKVQVQQKPVNRVNNTINVGDADEVTGTAKNRFFEYVDPTDTNTILEQAAVSHAPAPVSFGAWGYPRQQDRTITTRMKIDYIRIWQPQNLYADMEPVYQ